MPIKNLATIIRQGGGKHDVSRFFSVNIFRGRTVEQFYQCGGRVTGMSG